MPKANETLAFSKSEKDQQKDRELFVENLGKLLAQTREQVEHCYLDDAEFVHVCFKGGHEVRVNVMHDSYLGILKDVIQKI